MKLKILIIASIILLVTRADGQNIDPALTGAIVGAGIVENDRYNEIKSNQDAIQRAQTATILMVGKVNDIQTKIYDGLMQVSSVLKDAYHIKESLQCLNDILSYQKDMLAEAKQNPLALVFALKIQDEMVTKAVSYYGNIQSFVLKSNTKDLLMDAGERGKLLYQILLDLQTLRALAAYSYYKVHLAVMQGVINSINPFRGYVDIDRKIVDDLLANWKH